LPKGVYVGHGTPNRYEARIRFRSKRYNLGSFGTPEDAGVAYAEAAKRLHAEFARLT
jgi:hypothetical protein